MRKWNVTMKDGTEKVVEAEVFTPAESGDAVFFTDDEEVERFPYAKWKTVTGQ